mgnify:CR=1 FL=1
MVNTLKDWAPGWPLPKTKANKIGAAAQTPKNLTLPVKLQARIRRGIAHGLVLICMASIPGINSGLGFRGPVI